MTPLTTQMKVPSVTDSLRTFHSTGVGLEELIGRMRSMGLNQLECIKMVRDVAGMSLGEAKEVVHFSSAWAQRRESNEALHEAAIKAADELGWVETIE